MRKYVGTTMIYRHPHPSNTCEEELCKHHGHLCKVLRRLGPDEVDKEVGPMYKIRFGDGFETSAFKDELFLY